MKLSKALTKLHEKAVDLVESDKDLTIEERFFIAEHWNPAAEHNIGVSGTFFTPIALAKEMAVETLDREHMRELDLCAGTGRLALQFWANHRTGWGDGKLDIVCIENCPEFVRVGKRILPEATWIRGDAFEQSTFDNLGHFDEVISNPPYGLRTNNGWLHKHPSQYQAAEVAMKLADHAVFILPQTDCPFMFSGTKAFRTVENSKYQKFNKQTGIELQMNCGIDTSFAEALWTGTKIRTEIVLIAKGEGTC